MYKSMPQEEKKRVTLRSLAPQTTGEKFGELAASILKIMSKQVIPLPIHYRARHKTLKTQV